MTCVLMELQENCECESIKTTKANYKHCLFFGVKHARTIPAQQKDGVTHQLWQLKLTHDVWVALAAHFKTTLFSVPSFVSSPFCCSSLFISLQRHLWAGKTVLPGTKHSSRHSRRFFFFLRADGLTLTDPLAQKKNIQKAESRLWKWNYFLQP